MPLRISKIGYDGEHFGWNPGGAACSNKCEGCWSLAKVGPRMKCQRCQDNIVHLHEERLGDPKKRKKPATVLVNFTCDTFDRERPGEDVESILWAAMAAPQHTYVWLTKNAARAAMSRIALPSQDNWYIGLSIRNQADAIAKLPTFLQIPGKLFLSCEPLWGAVDWGEWLLCSECAGQINGDAEDVNIKADVRPQFHRCGRGGTCPLITGILVGHDNRRGAPGTETLDHIRSTVEQCKEASVRCYVKQLWIDGKLRTDPQYFPEDLRVRDLPWGEKEQGNG